MHGRVKVRSTAEQEEIKKTERAKKVVEYKAAINLIFAKRKQEIWDDEVLLLTEKMLLRNPDIYTLWNIRREAALKNKWSSEEYVEHLKKELTLTENCLRENPKSYSIWHHRCWVIDHLSEPDYKSELMLCAKCLNIDERNFHCWDYRNHIVKKSAVSDSEEFEFSTSKILNNFSNYSSWHYRSKLLSKMFPDESNRLPIRDDKHKEELDLVMNATFTDPNDSSAWFYQRWLLEYCKTVPAKLWRAEVTNHEAIIVFHEDISIEPLNLSLTIGEKVLDCQWKSCNDKIFAKIWSTSFTEDLSELDCKDICIKFEEHTYALSYLDSIWVYKTEVSQVEKYNESQLQDQLENYKQLHQMEPENKWALLTGIFLMKSIDFVQFHSNILNDLDLLATLDKLRSNYYKDLRSKCLIEYHLHNLWQEESANQASIRLDLSGLELTTLYNEHFFSFFEDVNLDANKLENSVSRLDALRKCTNLSLASNCIKSLARFPTLPNLKVLSLRNNEISSADEILQLVERHNLLKLDLRGNPVCSYNFKSTVITK